MTVERIKTSGGYLISDIVNNHLFKRRYFDYTRAEAIAEFRRERREEKAKGKAKQ
jgi:hypothetical protein